MIVRNQKARTTELRRFSHMQHIRSSFGFMLDAHGVGTNEREHKFQLVHAGELETRSDIDIDIDMGPLKWEQVGFRP